MKDTKTALTLNSVIFVMGVLGAVFTFTGVRLTGANDTVSGFSALKYYTVLSNIFAAVISGAAAVCEYLYMKGKIKTVPTPLYVLKLSATTCVSLTFLIVMIYLAPFNPDGFFSMFTNSNLLFHFVIPVLSFTVFVFYEKTKSIKFYYTFVSVIPTLFYGIFYAVIAALNTADGEIIPEYDWYRFFYGGVFAAVAIYIVILGLAYLISFLLWKFNSRRLTK